jgi:hypothetical protein
MATEVQNRSEPSLASLVGGIVNDMQDLVKQQLQLTRREIEDDLRKSKEAASVFVVGLGVGFLGAFFLCLMAVHLIHWLTLKPDAPGDPSFFPLWACHLVVAFALLVLAGILLAVGQHKLNSVSPINNPATEALKENVQWLTTPK